MKYFDVFAAPLFGGAEFLAFHRLPESGLLEAERIAAERGCRITRKYDLSEPLDAPDFAACVKL